jgi:hypothetical protein
MSVRRHLPKGFIAGCLAVALAAFSTISAEAANVVMFPDAGFSSGPYTIAFGSGTDSATYTFTYDAAEGVDQVSTGGDGSVNSFLSLPVPYELGASIPNGVYKTFTAFPTAASILYSASVDSIGLEFQLSDGIHYGYVTTFGPEVLQYGYNNTPGGFIATGSGVPEPSTWALLIIGLGALGLAARARTGMVLRRLQHGLG